MLTRAYGHPPRGGRESFLGRVVAHMQVLLILPVE